MINGNALLNELETIVYQRISRQYSEKTALKCCNALSLCLYLNFKSRLMYIPKTDKRNRAAEYAAIYNDFTGRNHKELAIKYRRSEQSIYAILKAQSQAATAAVQDDLFPKKQKDKKYLTQQVFEEYLPTELQACGISADYANDMAKQLLTHLSASYAGIAVVISKKILQQRQNREHSLFDDFN